MGQCRSAEPTYRSYAHPLHIPQKGRENTHREGKRERGEERKGDRNVNIEMCSIVTSDSYGE